MAQNKVCYTSLSFSGKTLCNKIMYIQICKNKVLVFSWLLSDWKDIMIQLQHNMKILFVVCDEMGPEKKIKHDLKVLARASKNGI